MHWWKAAAGASTAKTHGSRPWLHACYEQHGQEGELTKGLARVWPPLMGMLRMSPWRPHSSHSHL